MSSQLSNRIYLTLKAVKLLTNYPDLTISRSIEAKFRPFDLIKFLCFQSVGCFVLFYCLLNKVKYLNTGSVILDNGVNWLTWISFVIQVLGKLSLFLKKFKVWEIILLLNRCDELVSVLWTKKRSTNTPISDAEHLHTLKIEEIFVHHNCSTIFHHSSAIGGFYSDLLQQRSWYCLQIWDVLHILEFFGWHKFMHFVPFWGGGKTQRNEWVFSVSVYQFLIEVSIIFKILLVKD